MLLYAMAGFSTIIQLRSNLIKHPVVVNKVLAVTENGILYLFTGQLSDFEAMLFAAAAEIVAWTETRHTPHPDPSVLKRAFSFGVCTVVWQLWLTGGSLPLPNKLPH